MAAVKQESPEALAAPPPALETALRRLLRPIVRLLVDHRLTFPLLAAILKEIYVDVADREFALADRPQTSTRVHLLTGVHRKDVRRLRQETEGADASPQVASLGALLVSRWMGEAAYRDGDGSPRPLPRLASSGGSESFEGLVESVSKDIRPRAILDEWLRLGVAHVDADDRVVLNARAFVPEKGFAEKAFFFGRNLADHAAAGVHNLRGQSPTLPDRSVYYDGLSPDSVQELRELAERLGTDALLAVNERALALQRRDVKTAGHDGRMNFGIYFYETRRAEEGDDA
jgi:hypothetical protein